MSTLAYVIGYFVLGIISLYFAIILVALAIPAIATYGTGVIGLAIIAGFFWLDATYFGWALTGWAAIGLTCYLAYTLLKKRFFPDKTREQRRKELGYDD